MIEINIKGSKSWIRFKENEEVGDRLEIKTSIGVGVELE